MAAALATAAVLGGGLTTAGPASAAPPTVSFSTPTAGARVTTSSLKVDAKVTMTDGKLKSISLAVTPLSGGGAAVNAGPVAGGDSPTKDVSFGITLPFNGRYKAEITATGNDTLLGLGEDTTRKAAIEFLMVAPPAAPRSVRTVADVGTREVTISWARNAEPDLLFYLVQRSLGGGEYALAAKTTELSVVDTATNVAGGEYSYQVIAVRQGAVPDEGVNSNPSAVSTASVAAPPAPPTTVAPPSTVAVPAGTVTPAPPTPGSTQPAPATTVTSIPAGNPGALTRSGTVDLS
ncbi:MAG: fibronectin type III domain-containing protein, partial [Acidimicrobiales bacterium]